MQVSIPETMTAQKGYRLTDGDNTLEIIPASGDYSHSIASDNMIRYNDVFENVDIQYTVLGNTVKEDILF